MLLLGGIPIVLALSACVFATPPETGPDFRPSRWLAERDCPEHLHECRWLYESNCNLWPSRELCQPDGTVRVETWDCGELGLDETCMQERYTDEIGESPIRTVLMP